MCPPSETNGCSGDLKAQIEADFGSIDNMKAQFNAAAAARFGSGAWLRGVSALQSDETGSGG